MEVFGDDAQIESTLPEVAGPSGVSSPRILTKREFGQALEPIIASNVGYHVEQVTLATVSPTQVRVSGTVTLLMAGRTSLHNRDRLWGVRETWRSLAGGASTGSVSCDPATHGAEHDSWNILAPPLLSPPGRPQSRRATIPHSGTGMIP